MMLNKERMVEDLKNLISIASYEDESRVADYIINRLEADGLQPFKDQFGNVILTIGEGDGFLINAHMDTVGISGWEDKALVPLLKSGRIYGRGSSDTKSGIATMMEIARNLKGQNLKRKVIFLFSVNEEDSKLEENGAYLASKSIIATDGIVLEPTFSGKNLIIGIGCKGAYRFKIIIHGKSCHSSRPWLGINPVYLANDFINDFKKLKNTKKGYKILNKNVTINSVLNITEISAQEGANIIPSKCCLSIDYRAVPDEKVEMIRNKILKLCKKHFSLGFDMQEQCVKGYFDYDESILKLIKKTAIKHDYKSKFMITSGRNDGCIFSNYANMTPVCFGTGESEQGHTISESVLIQGFVDCSEMLYEIVKKLCL